MIFVDAIEKGATYMFDRYIGTEPTLDKMSYLALATVTGTTALALVAHRALWGARAVSLLGAVAGYTSVAVLTVGAAAMVFTALTLLPSFINAVCCTDPQKPKSLHHIATLGWNGTIVTAVSSAALFTLLGV